MKAAGIVLFLATTVSSSVMADTVYIRDTLYVPLRGGQSSEHRILHKGLKSGTPLERLEENRDSGYTRVRTPGGLEGWLQTQYLVDAPIAEDLLGGMTERLENLEATHQQTLLRLREANENNISLRDQVSDLSAENDALKKELQQVTDLASDVIAIDQENKRMNEDRTSLLEEIESLQGLNESLSDDSARVWFLQGAGVVLVSLLMGFILGRRIYNRRNTGGWA